MESIKPRNMHNLFWRKISLLVVAVLTLAIIEVEAQSSAKGNYNFWSFRKKPFYFGLTLGGHSTGYLTSNSRSFMNSDSIRIAEGVDKPGMHVHIITNLKIGQYFDFRFIPGFSFSERRIKYQNYNNGVPGRFDEERIESVFLDIPMLLRFKSEPYKDKRLFVVGGLKYSYDVSSYSRARDEVAVNLLQISPHDFQFEVGAGIQFFFPFFIFSPEIKYSQGIGNIHIFNGQKEESRVLDKILSRTLAISFHFEG